MTTPDEQAVRSTIEALFDAWRTLDPGRFAAAFPDDAQFTDVVGQTARGRGGIARQHEMPFTQLFKNAVIDLGDTPITFLTPDVAAAAARWTMSGHVSPQGETLAPRHGLMLVILAHRDRQWQPVLVQNTDYSGTYNRPGTNSANPPA